MIRVALAGPPHREGLVAEFNVHGDGVVDIPAEIYRDGNRFMIGIFAAEGGISWEYPVSDFLQAIAVGTGLLEEKVIESRS